MIASLYQSGSVALPAFFTRRPLLVARLSVWCGVESVVQPQHDVGSCEQMRKMCAGMHVRAQRDVVAAIMPL